MLRFALVAVALLLGACTDTPPPNPPTPTPMPEPEPEPEPESPRPESRARFEPPDGSVLVFAGQSNDAVGGHDVHDDGYVDHFGMPAGFSHYVGFLGAMTTPLGFEFFDDRIEGLSQWDTWGAGPMCLQCYLDDPDFTDTIVHLGLSMEFDSGQRLTRGEPDRDLDELAAFLTTHADHPFFLRIGYEFDGPWNGYEPETYKAAFIRIVEHLRAAGVDNFATVFASSTRFLPRETWEAYYPGDAYVDWLGYSWWGPDAGATDEASDGVAEALADAWDKPLLMAEVGPRGHRIGQDDSDTLVAWYQALFAHLEAHPRIKGLAIINNYWDPEPMWADGSWGDFRLQNDETVATLWRTRMADPRFIHRTDGVAALIGFDTP